MKNLQSNLLGRYVTITADTSNQLHVVVAVWLSDQPTGPTGPSYGRLTPMVVLERVNQFGKSLGGPLTTHRVTDITQ